MVGHRHAVDLRVDRVLDLRVLGVVVGLRLALLLGAVGLGERAPEVGGGVLGALVDDAPEAAVVTVGDQRELVRAVRLAGAAAMFTALVVVPLLLLALLLELLLPHAATSRAATPTAATMPIVRGSRLID